MIEKILQEWYGVYMNPVFFAHFFYKPKTSLKYRLLNRIKNKIQKKSTVTR